MENNNTTTTTSAALEKVVALIVATLEAGVAPWQKEWSAGENAPRNFVSGHYFSGTNKLLLSWTANDNFFATFEQVKANGGRVNKGAKGYHLLRPIIRKEKNDKGEEIERLVGFSSYVVFALKDTTGCKFERPAPKVVKPFEAIASLEAAFARHFAKPDSAPMTEGLVGAYYIPHAHAIHMPSRSTFTSASAFYATLAHEVGHSLMSEDQRKACAAGSAPFGSDPYAREELVAEFFSAAVMNDHGALAGNVLNNSAAYLQGWAKRIKADPTLFTSAASQADKRHAKFNG